MPNMYQEIVRCTEAKSSCLRWVTGEAATFATLRKVYDARMILWLT